jgi:hypothetical protein
LLTLQEREAVKQLKPLEDTWYKRQNFCGSVIACCY